MINIRIIKVLALCSLPLMYQYLSHHGPQWIFEVDNKGNVSSNSLMLSLGLFGFYLVLSIFNCFKEKE